VVTVEDCCFCHWPVERTALQKRLPAWLTAETAADDAWLTAIPHTVSSIASFGIDLTEPAETVTVRTYVRGPNGQRGVYFFGLFTEDPLAAAFSVPALQLPARDGRVERRSGTGDDRTRRTLDVDGMRTLDLRYAPEETAPTNAPPDSLASFLVERDRYFTSGPLGARLVGSVGHDPWPLVPVDATVTESLSSALGLPEPTGDPLFHYSPGTELGVSPPKPFWLD